MVDLGLPDPVAQGLWIDPGRSPTRFNAPDLVSGSRRRSTAILIARSRASSGYFLGAATTLILPWNESLHQTRHGTVDHIQGLVPLFDDPPEGFKAQEVWFNGLRHLPRDLLGYKDADLLADALQRQPATAWNKTWTASPNGAVVIPDTGQLPVRSIAGMEITLLSPDLATLTALVDEWPQAVLDAGLARQEPPDIRDDLLGKKPRDPGIGLRDLARLNDDEWDTSVRNRSSIAFLARFDQRTVLFGADAHADVLATALLRVNQGEPVPVDVCKVPHHGSRQNVKPDLLNLIDCNRWLISTSGDYHQHPDRRALARILAREPTQHLVFNYNSAQNVEYGTYATTAAFHNIVSYPLDGATGIRVQVTPTFAVKPWATN